MLFIRFYEGPAAAAGRQAPPPSDPVARLELLTRSLVDIDLIMGTLPSTIKKSIREAGLAAEAAAAAQR